MLNPIKNFVDYSSQNASLSSSNQASSYLEWTQRPPQIVDKITKVFNDLVNQKDHWRAHGDSSYGMCGIDERKLIQTMIKQAPASQKEFYILDIGAGDFQMGEAVAKALKKDDSLPSDMTVHLINVRGEHYEGPKLEESKHCKVHKLGGFKVEELERELEKEFGFSFKNQIDIAFSRMCFFHLVDPVGTFTQTLNSLKPERGLLMIDGFYFLLENETWDEIYPHRNSTDWRMITFLNATHAPFLVSYHGGKGFMDICNFAIRRPDNQPCRLPMSYLTTESADSAIGSCSVTKFKSELPQIYMISTLKGDGALRVLYGDRSLYNWIRKNELLPSSGTLSKWQPLLQKDDIFLSSLPLHQCSDLKQIEGCLNEGIDINEMDSQGNTALHLAIKNNKLEIFKFLLDNGAAFDAVNDEGFPPLHSAIRLEHGEEYVELLLRKGANPNPPPSRDYSLLRLAISLNKVKVIEILIDHGAKTRTSYEESAVRLFTSLGAKRFFRPEFVYGTGPSGILLSIKAWLEIGDCVVLHCNEQNAQVYLQNANEKNVGDVPPSLDDKRIIFVNVDPDLLKSDEWSSTLGHYKNRVDMLEQITSKSNAENAFHLLLHENKLSKRID
jgi:ankyrin repeat protein